MAVVLRFTTEGFTPDKYEQVKTQLEEAGASAPAGRLYHVCFGDKNNLRVSDIWDSPESFEKFAPTLKPVLEAAGVGESNIEFFEVHNIIVGEAASAATP
jgi:hypothetical protein